MKNIFKRLSAVFLAFAMIIGCMTVSFAAGDTVDWYYYSEDGEPEFVETLPYLGELTAGENIAGTDQDEDSFDDDGEQVCYSFTAESDGYYLFTLGDLDYFYNNYLYFSEDYADGKAYGIIYDEYYRVNNNGMDFIYYLTAGETAVILQNIEQFTVTYEFLGEEITDIVYDEKSLEGILGADYYADYSGSYGNGLCGEVLFSSGKTFGFTDSFSVDQRLVKGENTIEHEFLGIKKSITLKAYEAKDIISELKPVDFEDDLVIKEYYNGSHIFDRMIEAKIAVTYADGRTETIDFNEGLGEITLFNGRKYYVRAMIESETLSAIIRFAGEEYGSYELDVAPADYNENLEMLCIANSNWLYQAKEDLDWRLNRLDKVETLAEKISLVFWIPGIYTNAFYQIFCNIVEFIEYYI